MTERRVSAERQRRLEREGFTLEVTRAGKRLWRGYELQNENLVHSYFEKHPEELPAWDAFMDAATEQNLLVQRGIAFAAGVPEPEGPQELGYTPVGDRT